MQWHLSCEIRRGCQESWEGAASAPQLRQPEGSAKGPSRPREKPLRWKPLVSTLSVAESHGQVVQSVTGVQTGVHEPMCPTQRWFACTPRFPAFVVGIPLGALSDVISLSLSPCELLLPPCVHFPLLP